MGEYVTSAGLLVVGLGLLTLGGEMLVRGASQLAASARISPLVIGLTVVAFGTSAPELAVSLRACLAGQADIAVGNVVGSNICNTLLILGVSALIAPLIVSSQLVRWDVPLMIGASLLVLPLSIDGALGRLDGLLLSGLLLAYIVWSIRMGRKDAAAQQAAADALDREYRPPSRTTWATLLWQLCLVVVGLVLLTYGADWLVAGASNLARLWGWSELLIGLTVVALGTSLPEMAASVVAAIRGERDIAVGNIVGSNLFNLLCVLGLTAVAAPGGVPVSADALRFDIPVMIATAVACLPIFVTGHMIARWEGGLLFGYYCAYVAFLFLSATGAETARTFAAVMLWFVIPLTVLTLAVSVVRSMRAACAK